MKKQSQLGLVVEGNSAGSAILRLPKLAQDLGPLKSGSLRVSRRLSNTLRAGYAVAEYEELQAARLIVIRVPDASLPRILEELCSSELVFKELSFVLCETWLDTKALEPLRTRGASVATLLGVPGSRPNWFIVEGQIPAVRNTRRFLEENNARSSEIRSDAKELYFAAELLATTLPMPLLLAAQSALRASGLSGHHLSAILEEMTRKLFGDFLKGARGAWGGPFIESPAETADSYLRVLRERHPEIAGIVDEQLPSARRRMAKWNPKTQS